MERREAERLLAELRKETNDLRSKPTVGYRAVRKSLARLAEVAESVFGRDSAESKDARISVLSPTRLRRMGDSARKVPIIHRTSNVARILRAPDPSQDNYYRKALSRVDEAIVAMLYSLRNRRD